MMMTDDLNFHILSVAVKLFLALLNVFKVIREGKLRVLVFEVLLVGLWVRHLGLKMQAKVRLQAFLCYRLIKALLCKRSRRLLTPRRQPSFGRWPNGQPVSSFSLAFQRLFAAIGSFADHVPFWEGKTLAEIATLVRKGRAYNGANPHAKLLKCARMIYVIEKSPNKQQSGIVTIKRALVGN